MTNYRTYRNAKERAQRAGKKPVRALDGFEAEFGPCPREAPNAKWYDEVAVARAVAGQPVGRSLMPLEVVAVEQIRIKRARLEVPE